MKLAFTGQMAMPMHAQVTEHFFHQASEYAGTPMRLVTDPEKNEMSAPVQRLLPLGSLALLGFSDSKSRWKTTAGAGPWSEQIALAALLDSTPCGVLLVGPQDEIRALNNQFAEMMGQEPDELRCISSFDALVERLTPGFSDPVATAALWRGHRRLGEGCRSELEIVSPHRKVLHRVAGPLKDPEGRETGWMELYSDMTAERLVESNLFHTERMAVLGRLISSVAHEISSPLTSIAGTAELLLQRRPSARRDPNLQRILQEAERAGRIARNLLQLAHGDRPERRSVEMNEIVLGTLALRAHDMHFAQIETHLELDSGLPPVNGDATQLLQVLLNFLLNAEYAIQHGPGRGHIWVRTYVGRNGRVTVEVVDDGPGIAPEFLPRIFDPFFTTKPAGMGTGLGLSIAYGIAQAHGGSVTADSPPGAGATFKLELPAGTRSLPFPAGHEASLGKVRVAKRHSPAAGHGWRRSRSEKVLIIEDEPAVAALIADVVADQGRCAEIVPDGQKGLARIKARAWSLVICDLRLPNLSGQALFETLSAERHPLQQHFIFVTGDVLSPNTAKFLKTSGAPYLAKPFLLDELRDVIRRALDQNGELPRTKRRGARATGGVSRGKDGKGVDH
jgi:two-component system NtrC family sensor kinase